MAMSPWPKLKRDLVAILRGIRPEEIEPILERLIEAGFEAIEIPLNSPDPFVSIERAARLAPASVMIGAGTVLTPADVDRLAGCGGRLLVSPNVDGAVLDRAGELGLVSMPGIMTPTEAFTALRHGASGLKVFPAGVLGPAGIGAMRAVLPKATVIGAVGGIDETSFAAYRAVGVAAFGLGSSLYRPGMTADEVAVRAQRSIAAFDAAAAG
ncbi:2-dehydro-3-deoxy-6-phosphogalactonate aldolase [Cereibacter sphaeroides]|uniref:2-dehydro-3-deoxy-6-phosphogalactonate aldolase n=1 Tax=Cereibacter sphaeroides TaxID=1063 RepID=UPI000F51B32F|nr:2-dehydro-3-deoxy-6-phosphogalactonate aldolase [Cereibacter sphaeroides]AZB65415.1 2-dehydro-3-deoxy-6-phosphogalactonate aldolase [Cereibacter sphaeroides]AZB70112.1 2-dehydro-3-deoxy-6-phosphogalactonate aldolase [Cereibacter sphaeroides]